jgi:hypothetical protein
MSPSQTMTVPVPAAAPPPPIYAAAPPTQASPAAAAAAATTPSPTYAASAGSERPEHDCDGAGGRVRRWSVRGHAPRRVTIIGIVIGKRLPATAHIRRTSMRLPRCGAMRYCTLRCVWLMVDRTHGPHSRWQLPCRGRREREVLSPSGDVSCRIVSSRVHQAGFVRSRQT